MDRRIVFPASLPQDEDLLQVQRNIQITFGHLAQAVLGTSTLCDGLSCTPTTPASMSVQVGAGTIFQVAEIDQTAFGSLAPDTNSTVAIGCIDSTTTFPCTAPSVSGQTIAYLIEATLLTQDSSPVVLPYFNAANPSIAFNGPNNSAVAQNTARIQTVELQLKAGTAAAAGTQQTPAVDAGWVGLWVVTVNYGQNSITASNITPYNPSPFISVKLGGVTGGSGGGASALSQLSDVSDTNPVNGQALIFNGSKWANRLLTHNDISDWSSAVTGNGGATSLAGLSDVTETGLVSGQFLEWNGSRWVNHTLTHSDISDWATATANFSTGSTGNGGYSNILRFSNTGSWQVPAGVTKIRVICIGGGGGAGGSSDAQPGGGGGGGGYAESILQVTPGTNCTITLGIGGLGGPNGGGNGGNGTSTSFSTGSATVTASGGGGGNWTPGNFSYGGDAGQGTSGQLLLPGGYGGDGYGGPNGAFYILNPYGGSTVLAGSQHAAAIPGDAGTGDPGQTPGGGGGGVYYWAGTGGPGANGTVIIYY